MAMGKESRVYLFGRQRYAIPSPQRAFVVHAKKTASHSERLEWLAEQGFGVTS